MASTDSAGTAFSIEPNPALVDHRLVMRITGLVPKQDITVHIRTESDRGVKFASYGCFRANRAGEVDISKDECQQGTYTGIDAMGLFWSMRPEPGFEYTRFIKDDVTTPLVSKVYIYPHHRTLEEIHSGKLPCILTTEIHRWYKAAGVTRIEMRENSIRGTLFIPKGSGPFPAVMDLFGGMVGMCEFRAALLASRGFLALALSYIGNKGVTMDQILHVKTLDYFKEAINWLASHPLTNHGRIGIVGVSLGAFFANACSFISEKVKSSVLINGSPYLVIPQSYLKGERDPYDNQLLLAGGYNGGRQSAEGIHYKDSYTHYDEVLAKSWETKANYLSISGEDDQCTNPTNMEIWCSRWPQDQRHRIQFVKYKDAGHLIEPPYAPLNRVTIMKYPVEAKCVWGGRPEGHAHAQEDSWKRIQNFLRENLTSNTTPSRL